MHDHRGIVGARKSAGTPGRPGGHGRTGAGKSGPKVAITLRLDVDRVRRLQAIADAEEVTSVKLL
jgi:hypothetical protein